MAAKKPSRWQRPPENGKPIETESRPGGYQTLSLYIVVKVRSETERNSFFPLQLPSIVLFLNFIIIV